MFDILVGFGLFFGFTLTIYLIGAAHGYQAGKADVLDKVKMDFLDDDPERVNV